MKKYRQMTRRAISGGIYDNKKTWKKTGGICRIPPVREKTDPTPPRDSLETLYFQFENKQIMYDIFA